ncbi:MAG: hypothetical protein HWD59_12595 [Coxiellaceae bacterium]|nr:MAG: hypothetical protein HWD59_12595 [Coxiellaceae bacterium]
MLLACSDKLIIRTQQRLIMKYFFNNAGIKTADGRYFAINGVMTKYGFRQGTLEEVQVLNLKEVVSLSNTVTTISVSESDESLKEGKPVATSTFQHVQMQLTLAAPVSQAVPAVHNSELDIIKQQLEEERKLRRQHEEEIKAMQMKMEKLMRLHDLNDVDQSVDLGSQLQLKTQAKQQNSVHTGRPKATEQVLQIAYIEQQLVYHGKTLKKILDATQLTEVSDEETDPNADEREELFADNVSLT